MSMVTREFEIVSGPQADDLELVNLSGRESLGRPFQYDLEIVSSDFEIDPLGILGQLLTVKIGQKSNSAVSERFINGVVSQFSLTGYTGRYATYNASIVSWNWLLTRNSDCRIFQNKSVPDIIKEVFDGHGLSEYEDRLTASYRQWVYCVQYRETDFNFVNRLMEQEGIYYYFAHEQTKHTLILSDAISAHAPMPAPHNNLASRLTETENADAEYVDSWTVDHRIQPGVFANNSFDFERPTANLLRENAAPPGHDRDSFQIYDWQGDYVQGGDGETYSRIRIEELQAAHHVVQVSSKARGILTGGTFQLVDHPRDDQNIEYLVTESRLQLQNDLYEGQSGSEPAEYVQCSFTAIPSARVFRPRRVTPKPFVQGPQTAIVVGPAGEEIHVDDFGRVKVQFHWDRYGKNDDNSSCWIRVSQPWAGIGFGGVNIPRIGQEVIVDFLEGDPDQPIISGRVYNGDSMPNASNAGRDTPAPAGLEAAKMMTSFKSNSLGGSGGYNEITMNDTGGEEGLFFKAQKDEIHNVGNDRMDTVGNDETLAVVNNRSRSVGVDETVEIGNNQTLTVQVDRKRNVNGNESVTVAKLRDHTVGINEAITVGVAQEVTVGGLRTLTVGGPQETAIGLSHGESVGGNHSESVGGNQTSSVAKNRSATVKGNDTLKIDGKLTIDVAEEITIKTGDASLYMKNDGTIQLKGKNITVKGSGKITIDADGDTTIKGSKILAN